MLGGNTQAAASGENPLAGKSNYLIGAQDQWRQDIDNYAAVRYDEVYDGIDLRYYGSQRQLEYDFLLDPGANVGAIRLGFEGVQGVSVAENGDLVLDLGNGQNVAVQGAGVLSGRCAGARGGGQPLRRVRRRQRGLRGRQPTTPRAR